MILPDTIHPSWNQFITENVINEIYAIENEIGSNFNPTNPKNVLRFLETDLQKIKVIWLGQDVYPMKGVSTGRAFEVGGLDSWQKPFRQVSLKNIVRLLYKNYEGIEKYEDIPTFQQIKEEIASGRFKIESPNKWFQGLEEQGVLFLNKSFTCEIGVSNSHKHIWEHFSEQVLAYISQQNPDAIWFLWGKEAISNKKYIKQGIFYTSRHPMMCSSKYEDDFLKFEGFKKTMDIINWLVK